MPDFERAQYVEPVVIEGSIEPQSTAAYPRALACGVVAAAVGSVAYALIGFSGFMVSIVAIGVGWLVAKAMMTGSGGVSGRPYQIAAVALTYLAVTVGDLLDMIHYSGFPLSTIFRLKPGFMAEQMAAGPFLALNRPLNGALGLVILFVGLRAAWQIAAGGPGVDKGGRRMTPFGMR